MAKSIYHLGVVACLSVAHSVCHAQVTPSAASAPAATSAASAPAAARPTGKIYQQRQKDGSILFTDKPAESGAVTQRSWSVPVEDPAQAEKRREKARQEAKQDAQAVDERIQRHLERQQDREQALAIERMRLNQAQAQRDAEIARAERERSQQAVPQVVVVVPGQRPYHQRPPMGVSPPPQGSRPVVPAPVRPSASLCTAQKAADCNPSTEPARAGFGGR
jgi:hypothetical protein